MTLDSTLWELVAMQLTEHIRPDRGDRTWLDALNRIARAVLVPKGVRRPPLLAPKICQIVWSVRSHAQLLAAEKHHPEKHPGKYPPILLVLDGREFVIDGHKRVNHYLDAVAIEPLSVIVLTIRR